MNITEKFVRETLKNYEYLNYRAEHISEFLELSDYRYNLDTIEFEEEHIKYRFWYTCWGEVNYDYVDVPLKYLWMPDEEIKNDYEEMLRKREEEKQKMEKLREEAKLAAKERKERATYERLKAKYEND